MGDFAVIFDMDGVIVKSNPYQKRAWKQFFLNHGFDLNDEEMRLNVFGKVDSEILGHYFENLSQEQIKQYSLEKRNLFREFIKFHVNSPKNLHYFLFELKKKNICCAVATSSCPEDVNFILRSLRIEKYFRTVTNASHVINGKPHPEIYIRTANLIGYLPEKCIVIEDSIAGLESGLNAGMNVIGITTTHSKEELSRADMIIDDFSELNFDSLKGLLEKRL